MTDLDELIRQGNDLMDSPIGSPTYGVWRDDVRAAVAPYGESMQKVCERAFSGSVIMSGQRNTNGPKVRKVIELLELLKTREPEDTRARDVLINQKQAEARATLQSKFGTINVGGDATFGDGSPITKVTVSEFMAGLIKEVEAMPEGDDKHKILASLKAVVANPTFAAVSGSVVGEVIKKLMGGH